jgi:glucan phosphorylase
MSDTSIRPVAYFSSEFALSSVLQTYAGGLGILAGDMVRVAADEGFPLVGIGLFYQEGYVCQKMAPDGNVIEECPVLHPEQEGLHKVVDARGKEVLISLPIGADIVYACAWKWEEKGNAVYLLDTHVPENTEENQQITNRLYVEDKITRLKQQLILGIGGLRFLEKIGIHPSLYHMNEGHSAFLSLDLIRHEMAEHRISIRDAKKLARNHVVFTNHTLVAAGDETYPIDLITLVLGEYAHESQIPLDEIVEMGRIDSSQTFSLTHLGFRASGKATAVSRLHQEKAQTIWPEYEMEYVTNGVHEATWDQDMSKHKEVKKQLLDLVERETGVTWDEKTLLLGWARRLVSYKRPFAIFEDITRLLTLMQKTGEGVHIVISGFAPPGDEHATDTFAKLLEIINGPLKGNVVYLPNYTMELAQELVSGTDVWVNTPVVGFEACGTSGMKALLNGVLPLTTKDGWVAEAELFDIGWVLGSDDVTKSFLDILESEVLPVYYTNPQKWELMRQNAYALGKNQFTAARMLQDYKKKVYEPLLRLNG